MREVNEPLPKVTYKTLRMVFQHSAQSSFSQPSLSIWMITSSLSIKITYHALLLLEKVLLVVFPSEIINLCLQVHVVSPMALVAESEIHSRGENREVKRAVRWGFKK